MPIRTQLDSAINHLELLLAIVDPDQADVNSIQTAYEEIDYLLACLVSRQMS